MGNAIVRVNGRTYETLAPLGDGGFASVLIVERDEKQYALKWTRGVTEADQLQRLLLEIQVQRLLQHANSLPIVDAEVRICHASSSSSRSWSPTRRRKPNGLPQQRYDPAANTQTPKEVLMVLPLYPRGTLQSRLEHAFLQERRAPFSEADCLRIFGHLLSVVHALHTLGFAHRDLKPGNILLSSSDPVEPVLMDFGSVAPVSVAIRTPHDHIALCEQAAQFSSAPYRAPELWQASGCFATGCIDGRSDVWALGCVLYAMAFGPFSPFENAIEGVQPLAIFSGNVRFPPSSASFSSGFLSLIRWMLTPDINQRPTLQDVQQRVASLTRPSIFIRKASSKRASEQWADFSAFNDTLALGSPESSSFSMRRLSVRSSYHSRADSQAAKSEHEERSAPADLEELRRLSSKGKSLFTQAIQD